MPNLLDRYDGVLSLTLQINTGPQLCRMLGDNARNAHPRGVVCSWKDDGMHGRKSVSSIPPPFICRYARYLVEKSLVSESMGHLMIRLKGRTSSVAKEGWLDLAGGTGIKGVNHGRGEATLDSTLQRYY